MPGVSENGFEDAVPEFYEKRDVQRGCVLAVDRVGMPTEFPLLFSAAVGVRCPAKGLDSVDQVMRLAAEAWAGRDPGQGSRLVYV